MTSRNLTLKLLSIVMFLGFITAASGHSTSDIEMHLTLRQFDKNNSIILFDVTLTNHNVTPLVIKYKTKPPLISVVETTNGGFTRALEQLVKLPKKSDVSVLTLTIAPNQTITHQITHKLADIVRTETNAEFKAYLNSINLKHISSTPIRLNGIKQRLKN